MCAVLKAICCDAGTSNLVVRTSPRTSKRRSFLFRVCDDRTVLRRPLAALALVAVLAVGCGSDTDVVTSAPVSGCPDVELLRDRLIPQITYDYDPSATPADLARLSDVVLFASSITSVRVETIAPEEEDISSSGDQWIVLELDGVDVLVDNRSGGEAPTSISYEAGTIYEGLPSIDSFEGVSLLAFAVEWNRAPGGLTVLIEGLWLGCGTDTIAQSVIGSPPSKEWPSRRTLDILRDASTTSSVVEGSVDILTAESDTDEGMQALSGFTLHHDPDLNCLYHDEPDNNGEPGTGGRVVIVWPFGYTAVIDDGEVAVLDATGTAVARTNNTFTIGGGGRGANIDHCNAIGIWIANGPPNG